MRPASGSSSRPARIAVRDVEPCCAATVAPTRAQTDITSATRLIVRSPKSRVGRVGPVGRVGRVRTYATYLTYPTYTTYGCAAVVVARPLAARVHCLNQLII